ncbi:MAG: hypothetical protein SF002_17740, partial [Alphaproteobacteria bacterium]|nr:hypothetical protein [Alphaproteobacteria bacterium]
MLGLEAESNDVGDPTEVTITAAGVRIKGATIKGKLDLADCSGIGGEGLPALMLEGCRFEGDGHPDPDEPDVMTCLDLSHARLARLSLNGSRFSHLRAPHCRIDGALDISNVQPLDRWVAPAWHSVDPTAWRAYMQAWRNWHARRVKASVGNKPFEEAEPEKPKEPEAENRPPWPTAVGAHCWINLRGAQIDGDLAGANAKLLVAPPAKARSLHRYALTLANAVIHGSVRLSPGVMAFGGVSFHTAAIGRDRDMRGAILSESGNGTALQASQVSVGGTAIFHERFSAKGTIWLFGAKIDGTLDMDGAVLDGSGDNALTADDLSVGGSAFLRDNFIAKGPIRLLGAKIDG